VPLSGRARGANRGETGQPWARRLSARVPEE
jgi:hypothetical protein